MTHYTARIKSSNGATIDIPFTAPTVAAAKATVVLMVSAIQEPTDRICWERLTRAVGKTWARQMRPLPREIGEVFTIELLGVLDHRIDTFSSQEKIKQEFPESWWILPHIGDTEIDGYLQEVQ